MHLNAKSWGEGGVTNLQKHTDLTKEPNEEEEAKKNYKNRATALVHAALPPHKTELPS